MIRTCGKTAFAVILAWTSTATAEAVPVVYEDAYIVVHAAVVEAGNEPMHIGDALTLTVEISFDRGQVRIEALDGDYFERAFSSLAGVSLYGADSMTSTTDSTGRVRVAKKWRFQVVDCPEGMTYCPGLKAYELPLMTIAYRITGSPDRSEAARTARFTPWPGTITVVPAIPFEPGSEVDLYAILPGGAWPAGKTVDGSPAAGPALLAAAGLLLAIGFVAGNHRRRKPRAAVSRHDLAGRWARAAVHLRQSDMGDEEWADLLRRCITWYCVDELSTNPFGWLREDTSGAGEYDARTAACRNLFLAVLDETAVGVDRRDSLIARFQGATHAVTANRK